jgi:hypothetical protein
MPTSFNNIANSPSTSTLLVFLQKVNFTPSTIDLRSGKNLGQETDDIDCLILPLTCSWKPSPERLSLGWLATQSTILETRSPLYSNPQNRRS